MDARHRLAHRAAVTARHPFGNTEQRQDIEPVDLALIGAEPVHDLMGEVMAQRAAEQAAADDLRRQPRRIRQNVKCRALLRQPARAKLGRRLDHARREGGHA